MASAKGLGRTVKHTCIGRPLPRSPLHENLNKGIIILRKRKPEPTSLRAPETNLIYYEKNTESPVSPGKQIEADSHAQVGLEAGGSDAVSGLQIFPHKASRRFLAGIRVGAF